MLKMRLCYTLMPFIPSRTYTLSTLEITTTVLNVARKPAGVYRVLSCVAKLHPYLTLFSPGRGKWTFRYMFNKKANEIGLGKYLEVSFDEARKCHFVCLIQVQMA